MTFLPLALAPIEPASLGSVSGLGLLISAYAVIVGGLLAYGLRLYLQSRQLSIQSIALRQRV